MATGHLAAVDVNRHRRRRVCVGDHVVLERRDERAGLATARHDVGLLFELHDTCLGIATAHGE